MVRWLRWHCPPDTGFEIRALAVWGRARYLSVTEAPHNTDFHTWMGKKHFCFFQTAETGNRTPNPGWKEAVLTTTLGPPPNIQTSCSNTVPITRELVRASCVRQVQKFPDMEAKKRKKKCPPQDMTAKNAKRNVRHKIIYVRKKCKKKCPHKIGQMSIAR